MWLPFSARLHNVTSSRRTGDATRRGRAVRPSLAALEARLQPNNLLGLSAVLAALPAETMVDSGPKSLQTIGRRKKPREATSPAMPDSGAGSLSSPFVSPAPKVATNSLQTLAKPWVVETTFVTNQNNAGQSIALDASGKPVVAGNAGTRWAVGRLNTNATHDTKFDGDGKATYATQATTGQIGGIAVQADGKIVLGGGTGPTGAMEPTVARLNANGSYDTTFNRTGIATARTGIASTFYSSTGLVLNPTTRQVVLAGEHSSAAEVSVVRFNANGSHDTSFGPNGVVRIAGFRSGDPGYGGAGGALLQPDGKVVIGGQAQDTGTDGSSVLLAGLVRLNANGSPDASFGTGGRVTFQVPGLAATRVSDIAQDSSGRIIAVGRVRAEAGTDVPFDTFIMRVTPNGMLDTTFNGTGYKILDANVGGFDRAKAVAVQDMGVGQPQRIVVGGLAHANQGYLGEHDADSLLMRFLDDGSLDPTFNGGSPLRYDADPGLRDEIADLAISGSGSNAKIYAVGRAEAGSYQSFITMRFRSDGSVDTV